MYTTNQKTKWRETVYWKKTNGGTTAANLQPNKIKRGGGDSIATYLAAGQGQQKVVMFR
jgi:hypothetical protein